MGKSRQQLRQEARKGKKSNKGLIIGIIAAIVVLIAVAAILFFTLSSKDDAEYTLTSSTTEQTQTPDIESINTNNTQGEKTMENTKVKVTMENGGEFIIELYPEYAPETVENFINLVSDGFYDGVIFHRVVDGFMAQGGDPDGTGMGGSGETIRGEFAQNGFTQNTLSHQRGVISMARSMDPDSASSQFFICYDDASFLDGSYAAFGKVIEGMEVVDGFLDVERKPNSMGEMASPVEPIVMEKVEIIED